MIDVMDDVNLVCIYHKANFDIVTCRLQFISLVYEADILSGGYLASTL